jgi:hypothetical protein
MLPEIIARILPNALVTQICSNAANIEENRSPSQKFGCHTARSIRPANQFTALELGYGAHEMAMEIRAWAKSRKLRYGQLSDKTHRLIGLQHIFNSGHELLKGCKTGTRPGF